MSITIQVDHERQNLKVTAKGPVSLEDIKAHLEEEDANRAFGYREFVDATEATAAVSSADVRALVSILRDLGRKGALGPTAIVVSSDVTYGMCRMLEILLDDVCDVRPFRAHEREKAVEWLATAAIRGTTGAS